MDKRAYIVLIYNSISDMVTSEGVFLGSATRAMDYALRIAYNLANRWCALVTRDGYKYVVDCGITDGLERVYEIWVVNTEVIK